MTQRCSNNNIEKRCVQMETTSATRSTTAVDPQHLKVKQKYISLTKNYFITISIQKISSIHKFILKRQQILGYHELKDHGLFMTTPTQKPLNQFLAFLNLYQHTKNQFIQSVHFLDGQFQSPMTRLATPIFDHDHPKNF